MLKISYKPSTDSKEMKKEYETVNDFLQGQYLEFRHCKTILSLLLLL